MPKHSLSKSNYIQYLDCPAELWLYKNRHELIPEETADFLFKVEQGDLVDELAQQWFEEGALINNLVIPPKQASYQDDIRIEGYIAISDILVRNRDGSVSIFEVKGSTKVKKKHIHDSAFQRMVFERKGYTVRENYVVHLNKNYVFDGTINKQEILMATNITDKVEAILSETYKKAAEALVFINAAEPKPHIPLACNKKADCPFVQLHYPTFPEYSVFDIMRIHRKKLQALINKNILDIKDVPKDFPLSKRQRQQVDIAQSNKTEINRTAIQERLKSLNYPLYFLDYETFSYVYPAQTAYRPYQQMVFQYSLHILPAPDAELKHYGYILRERDESVERLIEHLHQYLLQDNGSVVVWSENFEKSRNKEMGKHYPKYAAYMEDINRRVFDLMDLFRDGLYISPKFKGSYSIKKVLPVLCPDLDYSILEINNGSLATLSWHKMTKENPTSEAYTRLYNALATYCHLDTYAMVRIWEELMKL